ncbi:zinc ribbon domain-containing protein [Allonocardiopsis opalescens]|uniref:Uncharacterized protein n=1 Tax=Allonocardiopsis opalescens TaxID=1144618 RepID=A0A2T0PU76_9ACTN|nr:C4-type zinc ribbon domain-containing protein [Allonocardiopsis opalescens]PRX92455.1 hypothetical protein CLV72_110216 [Allonocardiopsis opalescens]
MKADPAAQLRLLDLQSIDAGLDRLAHRRRTLPENAEAAALDARAAELRDAVVAAETSVSDLSREQAKAEGDVDQVRQRAERDQARLDGGQVSSPRELQNLQSEIASLRRRQNDLEEVVLEIMERLDDAQRRRDKALEERDAVIRERAAVEERRTAALADIEAEEGRIRPDRERIAAEIPADLGALYAKLREQFGGVGAAKLHRGRCDGCKLALSTVELNTIRASAPDEVIRCEECRRILVRTPDSGV